MFCDITFYVNPDVLQLNCIYNEIGLQKVSSYYKSYNRIYRNTRQLTNKSVQIVKR